MEVTLSGMTTEVRELQPENALPPMDVTPELSETVVILSLYMYQPGRLLEE